jgi:hypothetical protein
LALLVAMVADQEALESNKHLLLQLLLPLVCHTIRVSWGKIHPVGVRETVT